MDGGRVGGWDGTGEVGWRWMVDGGWWDGTGEVGWRWMVDGGLWDGTDAPVVKTIHLLARKNA